MADNVKATNKISGRAAAVSSGGVRQRRTATGATRSRTTATSSGSSGNAGGLWRFYTEDSTGLKIGPVPVLVMSLSFIAAVFILHIWGKYTRGH